MNLLLYTITLLLSTVPLFAFEGRIDVTVTKGGQVETSLYTVGTNALRIERGETDRPYPKNIVARDTGNVTLLFPANRSFVRLKPSPENQSAAPPAFPAMPAMPPGVGPQPQTPSAPAAIGPTNLPGVPQIPATPRMPQMQMPSGMNAGMPAMPMMPPMMEKMELTPTGQKTNLLGFPCERFVLRQRGQVMEIWATDKLLPFQPFMQNQPPRFGPRMIEEQWSDLVKAKKLFPLLAILRFETPASPGATNPPAPGPERMRFEVQSVTPEKIEDPDGALFQPPPDYHELEPLPF